MADVENPPPRQPSNTVVETIQSLIVAFVLAMTFRGFITEGFVIPTGSMAPTLRGQHKSLHAGQTGTPFAVGADKRLGNMPLDSLEDPNLGTIYPGSARAGSAAPTRMGDRILVLKSLFAFTEPDRFEVVVFKNPTNPSGEDGNYIKRLIGLPSESIWLVDGDVFVAPADAAREFDRYEVQRKPEHVQRAVWLPIYHSDRFPRDQTLLSPSFVPWIGTDWETEGAEYRCDTGDPTHLDWNGHIRPINDWASYNMLIQRGVRAWVPVSDVRVRAGVVPDNAGLSMTFQIKARGHVMQFLVSNGTAEVRMRSAEYGDEFPDEGWEGSGPQEIDALAGGRPTNVEFWHVDQALSLFIDGDRVAHHEYEWKPEDRLRYAGGGRGDDVEEIATMFKPTYATLSWRFEGSPVTLHRVQLDRDLYYRSDRLNEHSRKNPTNPGFEVQVGAGGARQWAAGTHPDNLAVLGADQFFMAGDNSSASSDSRLWGNPHPVVATQIDPAPFVVNRKLLLGKAWVVYFPAPMPLKKDGRAFIPDFGKLRFIR